MRSMTMAHAYRLILHIIIVMQSITFEASDRSRSLSLAQINNLGSDLSLASIAKIVRYLQVFVLTRSFLSIRFTRKVYPLCNAVFGFKYLEFPYHPSLGMVIAAHQHCKNGIEATACGGCAVYKKLSNEWTSISAYYLSMSHTVVCRTE